MNKWLNGWRERLDIAWLETVTLSYNSETLYFLCIFSIIFTTDTDLYILTQIFNLMLIYNCALAKNLILVLISSVSMLQNKESELLSYFTGQNFN